MSGQKYTKYRDPLELFLDDGFSNVETASQLRAAKFVVHRFEECFGTEANPEKREQGIKDVPVIQTCHRNRWLLITTDKDMRKTHIVQILQHPQVTILAIAHNGKIQLAEWVEAIILAKPRIERLFVHQPRPWCVQIDKHGEFSASCRTMTEADLSKKRKMAR